MFGIICLTLSQGWWGWKADTFYLSQLNVWSKLSVTRVLNYSCHVTFEGMKTAVKGCQYSDMNLSNFTKTFHIHAQTTTIMICFQRASGQPFHCFSRIFKRVFFKTQCAITLSLASNCPFLLIRFDLNSGMFVQVFNAWFVTCTG